MTQRLLYVVIGFVLALIILSALLLPSGNFTALDIWRFFLSPGIVALIAATFGARAGASSHIRASQSDQARTYLSLLDLVREDVRINMDIMLQTRERIRAIEGQDRKPGIFELAPESVHTMFFEDIEYPQLRKLVPRESITDIFQIRTITYVFEQWNRQVDKYYCEDSPIMRDDGEAKIIEHLTTDAPGRNFIAACEAALRAIDALQVQMSRLTAKKV
jgi:hypothetical protein